MPYKYLNIISKYLSLVAFKILKTNDLNKYIVISCKILPTLFIIYYIVPFLVWGRENTHSVEKGNIIKTGLFLVHLSSACINHDKWLVVLR